MKEAQQVATEIVRRLNKQGYTAYFAGGWVRDFLMGHSSDDIDIATTATPEEVIEIFDKTVEVGKAFGVVVVIQEGHQFEVASFRKEGRYLDGRKPESVEPATAEEDAERRDFTINGMFYDPIAKEIHDFVGGQEDIKSGVIRAIGSARERFVEDRLRMIRAVRFAARFDFEIDSETEEAIRASAATLYPSVSVERVWNELGRMAGRPHIRWAIKHLDSLGLLRVIFPEFKGKLEELVEPLAKIPKEVPAILFFAHLFPNEDSLSYFNRLRVSNRELKLLGYFQKVRDASASWELVDWAHLYAHEESELVLDVLAFSRDTTFHEEHRQRRAELATHVDRIQEKKPVVSAAFLKEQGVVPGPEMGRILREAERIAINKDLHDPIEVLEQLR